MSLLQGTKPRRDDAPPRPPRRRLRARLQHVPQALRALVRIDELWLLTLAAFIGACAGVLVFLMTAAAQGMHEFLFALPRHAHLSDMPSLAPWRVALVLPLGGLAVGLFGLLLARLHPRRAIDAIEANALYGGRMSLNDSLIVVAQTILSNGVGASIGLEAGYAQIGAGLASRFGRGFQVRRNDLRLLVGCGAAGAIAAAFDAPLAGAFYGFELVIGTYTLGTFAPVAAASLVAVSVLHTMGQAPFELHLTLPALRSADYVPILGTGLVCAFVGIALMRGVTLIEEAFRRSGIRAWLRPVLGGIVVGALALASPRVLSSGHGAIQSVIETSPQVYWVGLLVVMKALGSAVSIGSGFRGGLFFASLFLGALVGKFCGLALSLVSAHYAVPTTIMAVVGMNALAVAVIGGPLTMGFLALESTGSLPLTIAVLGASVVSAVTVRRSFGYSFATWRFHLRGEGIRSAIDIGWMRNLTVGRLMRQGVRSVPADMTVAAFRHDFPLGSTQRVVALDADGGYAGIVLVAEAHAEADPSHPLAAILHHRDTMLLPDMTIKDAMAKFEDAEADALAVVDNPEQRRVVGLLAEYYALRRYAEELERRRRELAGE
ncbi:MAG: chloride channel protein [Rhodospirillales bacterium]|nr:chloride channel protein [Rhodospirillales bacterium]